MNLKNASILAVDDDPDVRQTGQLRRDVQRVGDDGERLQLEELELARDLGGGGSRVEDDRFVLPDQPGLRPPPTILRQNASSTPTRCAPSCSPVPRSPVGPAGVRGCL